MENWLMAVNLVGRYAGGWSYIQGSTSNHENEGKTNNHGWMLYSVYAVLDVNSWSLHGEIERDDLTLCSAMMVELWTTKRGMRDEDENDVEVTSGYEKSGVRLAKFLWADLVLVLLHTGLGLVPAVSGMLNWLAHKILLSPSSSWWFPPSPLISLFLVLISTIASEYEVESSLSMSPWHYQELKPSTAYTEHSVHRAQHTPCKA